MYSISIFSPVELEILLFVLGIIIGSFLNVVIYRLPIILENKWQNDCAILGGHDPINSPVNLFFPSSHCVNCKNKIPFWSNIPIIGFLLLNGKCFFCKSKISIRYPLVEILSGTLFSVAGMYYEGLSLFAVLILISFVICLVFIDFDKFLLPDELTLLLLWLGLLFNLNGMLSGSLEGSVVGAILGYMVLWSIYWIYKLLTKKDGMGYGDFKFLAAILAWTGYVGIIPVTMLASSLGIVYFIIIYLSNKLLKGIAFKNILEQHIAFGPFLGAAAILYTLRPHFFMNLLGL